MTEDEKQAKRGYVRKRYYDNHDYELQRGRIYREENKDKINVKRLEKHTCECGGSYTYQNKQAHHQSEKHQRFVRQDTPKPDVRSTIYECSCGSLITLRSKSCHEKSSSHKRYLDQLTITSK